MSLTSQMRDTITVASRTGMSERGVPAYGPQRQLPARVVLGAGVGQEATTSDATVYCESELTVEDRVWLPGDDVADPNAGRKPQKVERAMDLRGSRTLWKASL